MRFANDFAVEHLYPKLVISSFAKYHFIWFPQLVPIANKSLSSDTWKATLALIYVSNNDINPAFSA